MSSLKISTLNMTSHPRIAIAIATLKTLRHEKYRGIIKTLRVDIILK